MKNPILTAVLWLTATALLAQENLRVDLGSLQTGATVSFVRSTNGEWGIEIVGGADIFNVETSLYRIPRQ